MISIGSLLARRQHLLPGNPSARADGNEDAVPIGLTARYPRLLCGELGSVVECGDEHSSHHTD